MKHLAIFTMGGILIAFSFYEINRLDPQFSNKHDLISSFYSIIIGAMILVLFFLIIKSNRKTKSK